MGEYLAEKGPRPDLRPQVELRELAQAFVHLLWLRRFAPLTRYLTSRRMLDGADNAAMEKVRQAFIRRRDDEPETFIRVGLRTLGIPQPWVKGLFDPDR